MARTGSLSAVLVSVTLFAACASAPVRDCTGDSVDPSRAALVHVAPGLVVTSVDGSTACRGASSVSRPLSLRLVPGWRRVTVYLRLEELHDQVLIQVFTTSQSDPVELDLDLEDGRSYRLEVNSYGDRWWPGLVDADP